MAHNLRLWTTLMVWALSTWMLAMPLHAKGVFDDWPKATSTKITPSTKAGKKIQLVIDFLKRVGETSTATSLQTALNTGTLYYDGSIRQEDATADTNSDGEITFDSGLVGINPKNPQAESDWTMDGNFSQIINLSKTLFHENIHTTQSALFKMGSNYVHLVGTGDAGHEVEAWTQTITAVGNWSVVLSKEYIAVPVGDMQGQLTAINRLIDVQMLWKGTIEGFQGAGGGYYGLDANTAALYPPMIDNIAGFIKHSKLEREQLMNPVQIQIFTPSTSTQPAPPQPAPSAEDIRQAALKRQDAQYHQGQAIKHDEQADVESEQADEWRELADDARENAKKNRERAEYWRRQGREDWADDWEEEAQRDDKLAEERDAEADRLDEEAGEDKKRAEDERSQAQTLEDEADKLNPNKQVGSLIDQMQNDMMTLLARVEARTPSLPKEDEVSVNFIGHGRAAGEIFTCQVTNNTDGLLAFNLPVGMIFQPSNPTFQTMIGGAPINLEVPPGATRSTPVSGYCLEPGKSPPPAASTQGARGPARFILIATEEPAGPASNGKLQWKGPLNPNTLAPYQPMIKIVQAGNRLAANGRYARGIQEPKEYQTMVIQRALWYQATRNTPQPMGKDALKLELQKQLGALPAEKRPSPEKIAQTVERIWGDVELTLSEAGL